MVRGPRGPRRIRLVAYGARLESVLSESSQGFESPILRQSDPGVFRDRNVFAASLTNDLITPSPRIEPASTVGAGNQTSMRARSRAARMSCRADRALPPTPHTRGVTRRRCSVALGDRSVSFVRAGRVVDAARVRRHHEHASRIACVTGNCRRIVRKPRSTELNDWGMMGLNLAAVRVCVSARENGAI